MKNKKTIVTIIFLLGISAISITAYIALSNNADLPSSDAAKSISHKEDSTESEPRDNDSKKTSTSKHRDKKVDKKSRKTDSDHQTASAKNSAMPEKINKPSSTATGHKKSGSRANSHKKSSPAPKQKTCAKHTNACAPKGNRGNWRQVFVDDFTKDAPTGSFGTSDPKDIVYTGDGGGGWYTYPDGWNTTYPKGNRDTYEPHRVLSVHDGVLDFNLRPYNGRRVGGNLSPILSSGSNYQLFGRYDARMKVTYNDAKRMNNYKVAWLLWPKRDRDWEHAESDFPETSLWRKSVMAASHYGGRGSQQLFDSDDVFGKDGLDLSRWHTYTQEWGPGYRKYYVDGILIGKATKQIWDQPQRWQLQTEPNSYIDSGSTGHVLVDWVSVYAYK